MTLRLTPSSLCFDFRRAILFFIIGLVACLAIQPARQAASSHDALPTASPSSSPVRRPNKTQASSTPTPSPAHPFRLNPGTTQAAAMPTPTPQPVTRATEITPPPGVAAHARPDSVTLRAGTHSDNIKALTIKRQFQLSQLRANPLITLGQTKVNLAPIFNNPSALPNVATRLRAIPQLAELMSDDTQVLEVPQGLVLHHFLSYRLKPGVCSDSVRRRALISSGVHCATQIKYETRAAAFATRGDPHYIANPAQRAVAIADDKKKSAAMRLQVVAHLTKLRTLLNNPTDRAQIDSLRGAGEASRLSALSDEQLTAEIINSGVTKIEQVMFVPRADRLDEIKKFSNRAQIDSVRGAGAAALLSALNDEQLKAEDINAGVIKIKPVMFVSTSATSEETKTGQLSRTGVAAKPNIGSLGLMTPELTKAPARGPSAATSDKPLEPRIFLTGFTLGRKYEWRQRVEQTISWCIVDCEDTYFAEVYAGFDYGFGLRFPIRLDGTYHYSNSGDSETATVTTNFTPIDGSPDDYAAAGLDESKIFNGKELVAQFGAYAGASYSLPFTPDGGVEIDKNFDFTADLPAPFTNGQFTPPAPGQNLSGLVKIFDYFDLIGGQANFGVAGAQVFPAVKVDLHSDSLRFTLHDDVKNADIPLNSSGLTTNLGINPNDHLSSFAIRNPIYNLGFLVTPGLDAHLFIDLDVWSDSWDWPVWFPQLAIQLPPGGVDFSCHEGTVCTRNYQPIAEGQIDKWGKDFEDRWLRLCADDTCKFGIRFVRLGAALKLKQQQDARENVKLSDLKLVFDQAAPDANAVIQEAYRRQDANFLEADKNFILAVFSAKCSDKLCFDNVAAIMNREQADVTKRHSLAPDEDIAGLYAKVQREYGFKQLQAEIDASTARQRFRKSNRAPE